MLYYSQLSTQHYILLLLFHHCYLLLDILHSFYQQNLNQVRINNILFYQKRFTFKVLGQRTKRVHHLENELTCHQIQILSNFAHKQLEDNLRPKGHSKEMIKLLAGILRYNRNLHTWILILVCNKFRFKRIKILQTIILPIFQNSNYCNELNQLVIQ
ncbi:transmembrane protein, putative (macronuclear) [Tetrahymena thermophila SB210]|uniref:Transmembrane protein, putative n=1 Tax=Tetrahymena thermophila (strain SB210) TaxID=312017 RepID=W7XAT6_TETTS|nr:transmembrane protein, putative [Tetrahymena thermophila SB210]EWS76490.1 transmembrane protein, putative [Tetrahymena thermophila SB210]|eukprot:XP_012650975.1 transmembrane protein, putative [Tetrahymena thermophila SB210]